MVSVSDLTTYSYCKRKVWLLRKAKIQTGERDWNSIVKYRLIRSISNLVDSKDKIHSLTDFMYETLHEVPGEIVDTEIYLGREKLSGRIDVIRKTEEGYIIQEEKSSDPPMGDGVWPDHLLQVSAYAFLAGGGSRYSPIVGAIIIYNDLKPRKVKPNPEKAKDVLEKVIHLLESNILPKAEENAKKCRKCNYYPLCQILPQEGELEDAEIKNLFTRGKEVLSISRT
ncbi:MAG: CRISPR-associated protein Cas4 [Candidatus Bathyarchaeota archaeon]|nr:CRISPR-associated protein Cas4 [Candidatus Bathyarchaeota archaeon]